MTTVDTLLPPKLLRVKDYSYKTNTGLTYLTSDVSIS